MKGHALSWNWPLGSRLAGAAPRPTYRAVQHCGDEVIADALHLVGCQLCLVQLFRLREDGAFGIHTNDLHNGWYQASGLICTWLAIIGVAVPIPDRPR